MILENWLQKLLNSFFSSAVKDLRISKFQELDPLVDKISHQTLKAMVKYRYHPSIIAIKNANKRSHFHFSYVSTNYILNLFQFNVTFLYPWKCQKAIGFLTFSAGIEMWHWKLKIGHSEGYSEYLSKYWKKSLIFLQNTFLSFLLNL